MSADDEASQKDQRQRLLDEIKRRAEEAELKRIEDEEKQSAPRRPPVPPPVDPPGNVEPPEPLSRVEEVRERLVIALDRGLPDKAGPLLGEFSTLAPNDPELRAYQLRLAVLQENQQSVKVKKRSPEKMREDAQRQRESLKKKLSDLLAQAAKHYEYEKYDLALKDIEEILAEDEENEEATKLKEEIEKAKVLADQIREEEARRKAEETAAAPPPQARKEPVREGDPWGETIKESKSETVYHDVAEEAAAAPKVRKRPFVERAVERASKIHIPVKPVLIVAGIALVVTAAYFIITAVQNAVFPPKYSLIIFPGTTNTRDGSLDYYVEGYGEELINAVAVASDLRLIGPGTSLTFQDPRLHNAQSAKLVGAGSFVVWNLDRSGDVVTVNVSMYDTMQANPVWSNEFKGSVREAAALRVEIARAMLSQLGVTTTPAQEQSLTSALPFYGDAYDAYLHGMYFLRRPDSASLSASLEWFRQSLDADSSVAATCAAAGRAHLLLYELGIDSSRSHFERAHQLARRALSIDPKCPEGLLLSGIMMSSYMNDIEKAKELAEGAAAVLPGSAEVHRSLSHVYLRSGAVQEALRSAHQSVSLDPRAMDSFTRLGSAYLYKALYTDQDQTHRLVDFDSARVQYERAASLSPNPVEYSAQWLADALMYVQQHDRSIRILVDRTALLRESYIDLYKLGRVYQSAGKPVNQWKAVFQRSRDVLRSRISSSPADAVAYSYLALVHTRLGESRQAQTATKRALELGPANVVVLYNVARMHAIQKNTAEALAFLSKAIEKHWQVEAVLDIDFFNIQNEPEFRRAIAQ